jgi:CheY-like chemotaxis protein
VTPADHDPLPTTASASGPRILVVDDEARNRQLVDVILAPEGYRLEAVASGAEALAAVAREAPDLILLDIMMPGMDGYRVLTALKGNEATKQIPVVLVSALDDANTQTHGKNLGADAFLAKPVSRAHLSGLVRGLLRL